MPGIISCDRRPCGGLAEAGLRSSLRCSRLMPGTIWCDRRPWPTRGLIILLKESEAASGAPEPWLSLGTKVQNFSPKWFPGRWHLLHMLNTPQQIESTVWYRSDSDRYRLSFRCFRGHFCMGINTCSTWRGCRHSHTYVQCSPVGMGRPVAAGEI